MSREVDQRVVQMQFDNAQFERGAQTSLNTMERLKKTMNFDGAAKGLNEVGEASKRLNFDSIANGVDTIASRFSTLGIIGVTALQNITNSLIDMGKHLAYSLSFEQINAGWDKYAEKTSAVQTIMAATAKDFTDTGEQMAYVNEQLDRLNWFTDETSYNFVDMVGNIGKFTSNGIKLDEAASSMQGIATWAAISGANAGEASRAMYNLSQAISTGTVKLIDWKSIENANMATTEFKQTAIETAVALGTLTEAGDGVYKTVKGNEVAINNFNEALSDGWFTKDVLLQTLDKYGAFSVRLSEVTEDLGLTATQTLEYIDQYKEGTLDLSKVQKETGKTTEELKALFEELGGEQYELGRRAFKAAQEAKTFQEAIDATKDAVSTGWMKTFELIFGDYEEAKKLWTGLANVLYDVFAAPGEARNDMFAEWADLGGRTAMLETFSNAWKALLSIVSPIKEAFRDIFPAMTGKRLADITKRVSEFTAKLILSEDASNGIKVIFTALFKVLRLGGNVLSGVAKVLGTFVSYVFRGINAVLEFIGSEEKLIDKSKILGTIFEKLHGFVEKVVNAFKGLGSIDLKLPSFNLEGGSAFGDFISAIGSALGGGFVALGNGAVKVFGFLTEAIKQFTSALSAPDLMKALTSGVLGVGFANLMMSFGNMLGGSSLGEAAEGLVDKIKGIFDGVGGAVSAFEKKTKAETLKSIAISIAILAASCVALASVDPGRLAAATAAIAGLAAELMGTMKVFSGMDVLDKAQSKSMRKMAIMMIEISIAVLILASAVKKLGSMDLGSLVKGLIGTAAAMGILVGASKLLEKNSKGLVKSAFSMIIFATALRIMASAVSAFAQIKFSSMVKGLIGSAVAMGQMVAFAKMMEGTKISISTGVAMIAIAAAMLVMSKAVESFSKLDWEGLAKGGVAVAGLLGIIAAFGQLSASGGKMIVLGISLIAISAGLVIFASAMTKLSSIDWGGIAKAGVAIVGLLAALTAMSMFANGLNLIAIGIALIGVSVGLVMFASAVAKIGSVDWGGIAKAGVAIGVFMAALTGMSLVANGVNLLAIGVSIILIANAMLVLATAMKMLGSMSWGQIVEGLVALVGVFALVGTAGALLAPIAVPILLISAAMVGLSVAVFLLTSSLLALNAASATIGVALSALGEGIANAIVSFVTALAAATGEMIPALVALIEALCDALLEATPKVLETVVTVLTQALAALVALTPRVVEAGMQILTSFLKGIANHIGEITDLAISIVVNFIDSVSNRLPDIIQSGVNLILSFIEGIAQALNDPANQQRLSEAITNLINGVLNTGKAVILGFLGPFKGAGQKITQSGLVQGIKSKAAQIKSSIANGIRSAINGARSFVSNALQLGKDLVQGVINGIGSLASSLASKMRNLISNALSAAKSEADSNSPSKKTTEQGVWLGQGYIVGITRMAPAVAMAMEDMVGGALETAATAMSKVDDSFAYTPQVTPVVDMSNVASSMGDISNLFAKSSTADLTATINGEMDANKAVLDYISNLDKANSRRNNDVVSALRDLQRDFQTLGDRIDNIEMVMDSGEVVGALTGKMDRALGRQVSKRNRGI